MPALVLLNDRQHAALLAVLQHGFSRPTRQRGLALLNKGALRSFETGIDPKAGHVAFFAGIEDASAYEVQWRFTPSTGWAHQCTCGRRGGCTHAYVAGRAALGTAAGNAVDLMDAPLAPPAAGAAPASPRPVLASPDEQSLIALLEQRHGRPLASAERNYIRDLTLLWRRQRTKCSIAAGELARLSLAPLAAYPPDYPPIIEGWWDADSSPATVLEFWQYLALYGERSSHSIPAFLLPVTDTAPARDRLAARERLRLVQQWTRAFAEDRTSVSGASPRPVLPQQIRLRLTSPKLTWECRDSSEGPWRTAKAEVAGDWLASLVDSPVGADPTTLALLQEVQLSRNRLHYWSGNETQVFKLTEARTLDLLFRLLEQPVLRGRLAAEDGSPFPDTRVALHWRGRPAPERPEDIVFELEQPDGRPAPDHLLMLPGRPALALAGASVFELPPPLPGTNPRRVVVPREALTSLAAAKCLHRAAARLEGVALPAIEVITLRARFICALTARRIQSLYPGDCSESLEVELHGISPDGTLVQRRNSDGGWLSLSGSAASTSDRLVEIERQRVEAAVPLLFEFNLTADFDSHCWQRSASTKNFPDQFSTWAERVRSLGVEIECCPELAGLCRPPDRARVEVSVKPEDSGTGIDWFDLEIAVRAEDTTLTDAELKLLLKAKGRVVRLPGKGWRRLNLELAPEEVAKLAELGLDATALEGGSEKQRFHALQLADERIAGLLPEQHAARARQRAAQLATIAEPPVPAGLSAELRPYQREGFHFLAHLSANGLGGILADDMGLGKTVQALAWLLHLADQRRADPAARPLRALVVCPKSVVPNWTRETRRFAPSLTAATLQGGAVPAGTNLVVANYAQLRLAAEPLTAELWDAVILDEGQNIKNPQSQTALTARELRAAHRIVLTGTPIENRTLDLWSLFAFAMPGLLGSQASFRRAFNDKTDPAAARSRLARRVKHFMLRRTKGQVAADLPPRTEEDLFVELDGNQRLLYEAELKRTRAMLLGVQTARDFDKQRFNILQSLLRLRQICCDPRLVGYEEAKAGRPRKRKPSAPATADTPAASAKTGDNGSAKLEALLDTLEPLVEEGHRVLVFSQFVTMLELIASELTARGIKHLMLTGQTENRQDLVDRFQAPEGEPVFLLSLKAAGSGLNLTAASYVVLYDPWWNPAVEAQAIDRTHRIGQTEHVIAYRILARGTIEEKIRKLQQSKSELARSIVQEESLATVMSLDDLRFVLGTDGAEQAM